MNKWQQLLVEHRGHTIMMCGFKKKLYVVWKTLNKSNELSESNLMKQKDSWDLLERNMLHIVKTI